MDTGQHTVFVEIFWDRGPGLMWQGSRSFVHVRWKLAGDFEIKPRDGTVICVASARGVTLNI